MNVQNEFIRRPHSERIKKAKPMLESCSTIKNCALFKQSLHTLVGDKQ